MIEMTNEQIREFDQLATKMMDFLHSNTDPHITVLITSSYAELLQGERSLVKDRY